MNKTKIDYKYIAGFFDGEGSAMILTIKRKNDIYRFRPVIKIVQKTHKVLYLIKKELGLGTIFKDKRSDVFCYQINGNKKILKFVESVSPFLIIKKKQLILIKKLISLQYRKNKPYTKRELKYIISIRNKVHNLNSINRKNIFLKYSREKILSESYE